MAIPPRQEQVSDKQIRFYVHAPASVKLALHHEAMQRGVDVWDLGGAVISSWLRAGCPDFEEKAQVSAEDEEVKK